MESRRQHTLVVACFLFSHLILSLLFFLCALRVLCG
jgi:hypothetical protein